MTIVEVVAIVAKKSPLQRKRLEAYLADRDDAYHEEANAYLRKIDAFLKSQGATIEYAIDAYLSLCGTMLRCQLNYLKSGKYPVASAAEAKERVYDHRRTMMAYVIALGLSQFLWPTHREIFEFFKGAVSNSSGARTYLEIGPGHGLFLEAALGRLKGVEIATAIDISPTSLELSGAIVDFLGYSKRVKLIQGDVTRHQFQESFDFIVMGEVLEHVENPSELLLRLGSLLAPGGRAFLSTCAHCPAIDHVSQFTSMSQVRGLLADNGLRIIRDLALPVENVSVQDAEEKRITINYCALVENEKNPTN